MQNVVHLLGTGEAWDTLQVFGSPTHITITRYGTIERTVGTMSADTLRGTWAE